MASTPRSATPLRARKAAFIAALTENGVVSKACEAAEIDRRTAYRWRKDDPDLAEQWEDALETFADKIEDAARQRAVDGWDENVTSNGKVIGTKHVYSDSLLLALLKAKRPSQYRERQSLDVTSSGKELQALTLDGLADTDKREILKLAYESTFDASK